MANIYLPTPPTWSGVDSKEMELWFNQVQNSVNEGFEEADGFQNLRLVNASGEIIQGEELYGYFRRYLFVRFATDPDGNNLIPTPQSTSLNRIYVGTFNNATPILPAGANFVFREFEWGPAHRLSYDVLGGRRIDFNSGVVIPDGYVEVTQNVTIDLDLGRQNGFNNATVEIFNRSAMQPTSRPSDNATYVFSTGELVFGDPTPSVALPEQGVITVDPSASVQAGDPGSPEVATLTVGLATRIRAGWTISNNQSALVTNITFNVGGVFTTSDLNLTGTPSITQIRDAIAAASNLPIGFEVSEVDTVNDSFDIYAENTTGTPQIQFALSSQASIDINGTTRTANNAGITPLVTFISITAQGTSGLPASTPRTELLDVPQNTPFTYNVDTSSVTYPIEDDLTPTPGANRGNFSLFSSRRGSQSGIPVFAPSIARPEITDFDGLLAYLSMYEGRVSFGGDFEITRVYATGTTLHFDVTYLGPSFAIIDIQSNSLELGVDSFSTQGLGIPGSAGSFNAVSLPSQLRISSGMVDETLTLTAGLTDVTAVANDIITRFNGNTNLRSIFSTASLVGTNQITFQTLVAGDVTIQVAEIPNTGTLTVTETFMNGRTGTFLAPIVRVNTPSDTATVTDIALRGNEGANEIAQEIEDALAANGYSVSRVRNVVTYSRILLGAADDITVTVPTQGGSNLTDSLFTVVVTQQGMGASAGSTQTVSNGWYTRSDLVPAGTDPIWLRRAVAISRGNTDIIEPPEWSGAIQAGTTGADGDDGRTKPLSICTRGQPLSLNPANLLWKPLTPLPLQPSHQLPKVDGQPLSQLSPMRWLVMGSFGLQQ